MIATSRIALLAVRQHARACLLGWEHRWMSSGELHLKRVFEVEGRITEAGLKSSSTQLVPAQCVLIGLAGQGKTRGTVAINMVPLCTNNQSPQSSPKGRGNRGREKV